METGLCPRLLTYFENQLYSSESEEETLADLAIGKRLKRQFS